MTYIIGMDGGGSKAVTVIANETGRLLGRGIAGRGNHQISGMNEVDIVRSKPRFQQRHLGRSTVIAQYGSR